MVKPVAIPPMTDFTAASYNIHQAIARTDGTIAGASSKL
jgi:hypothetical protein